MTEKPSLQSIHPSVWMAPGVQIYGKVSIGEGSSLWPYCVIRAEAQEVRVGRFTSIQDFVMLHVGYDHPTLIGDYCTVAHHATVHGATLEEACLVGVGATLMDGAVVGPRPPPARAHGATLEEACLVGVGATLMDGAVVGPGSIVAGGAVVTEGRIFPPGSIIAGAPARLIRERDCSRANRLNAWLYHRNAQAYRRGDHRAWDGPEYEAWLQAKREEVEEDGDLGEPL